MISYRNYNFALTKLVDKDLASFSTIQKIMKMAEKRNIVKMGFNPNDVISFGGGWCNHFTPESLREIYIDIINDKELFHKSGRYSPIIGDYHCRKQICEFEREIYHLRGLQPSNILLGHSSTQLFHDIIRVLCDPGDSICVMDPTYANYINSIKCAVPGSKLRFIPALDVKSWKYLSDPESSLEILKNYCSNGVKVFVIPVPDNPTSQIPEDSFLRSSLEILDDYKGFLVLDFAYKALWFDRMPKCFSWSSSEFSNLISLHSNSKWLSSLGRRLGWIEANKNIISGLEKINESVLLSPDTLHSIATAKFLEKTIGDNSLKDYIDKTRKLYKETADVMIKPIDDKLFWKRLSPMGGLYICCPTPNDKNPVSFVEEVFRATGVLIIPGLGFGPSMEKAVRFSYGSICYDHGKIEEGMERIEDYLNRK